MQTYIAINDIMDDPKNVQLTRIITSGNIDMSREVQALQVKVAQICGSERQCAARTYLRHTLSCLTSHVKTWKEEREWPVKISQVPNIMNYTPEQWAGVQEAVKHFLDVSWDKLFDAVTYMVMGEPGKYIYNIVLSDTHVLRITYKPNPGNGESQWLH